jgi:hypothetical protein
VTSCEDCTCKKQHVLSLHVPSCWSGRRDGTCCVAVRIVYTEVCSVRCSVRASRSHIGDLPAHIRPAAQQAQSRQSSCGNEGEEARSASPRAGDVAPWGRAKTGSQGDGGHGCVDDGETCWTA